MTHRVVGLGFGLLFLLVQVGCNDIVTPPPTAGIGGGGNGIALCADEGGPLVSILQPVATSDPSADTLATAPDLSIECLVESSGEPVDDSSVVIQVLGEGGATATPSVVNRGDGSFEATASISSFANGSLQVSCEASNSEGTRACTGVAVDTLLDLGPGVEILSPSASGAILSGAMTVRYVVTALPVTDADTVDSVPVSWQVVVAGQPIDSVLESQTDTTATFSATVNFDDPTLYQTPLDGMYQLSVSSTNGRGVTRTETLEVTVDSAGPGITIDEPELGEVIGGATDVVATISDPSGIDPSQVSFSIGSEKFDMSPVSGTSNRFQGSFDANQYPTSIGEVTINVVAFDIAGNEYTASVVVELDGVPPIMELDPADVREGREAKDGLECSALFDPLGADRPSSGEGGAIDEGDIVKAISYIRARVEDRGNPTASYKSGVDSGSVQVWILGDPSKALVIDTDDDSTCDSLNPDVLPGNQVGNTPAVAIDLTALSPTGTADFLPGQTFGGAPQYSSCTSGTATDPGDTVCNNVTLPRFIPDNTDPTGSNPGIYVKGPITSIYCMGDPFDWQTALDGIEGPACMAVAAQDERGNSSVSPPLRVCFAAVLPWEPLPPGHPCLTFDPNDFLCTNGCSGARFPLNERIGPFE